MTHTHSYKPAFLLWIGMLLFIGCKPGLTTIEETHKTETQDTLAEAKPIPEIPIMEQPPVVEEESWKANVPYAIEEFRAAWVATVANINWPSRPGLPVEEQKKEALALLNFLKKHHFNAVIFQVRPQADALYASELEPWSYFLTGTEGKAPTPYYDPLEFWITEAHRRGLELHAWLNPYRAHHTTAKDISDQSIIRTQKDMVVELANGMWWMDPSLEATKEHTLAVVMDIVKRYDIDGIHMDDYFYPYESYNKGKDFPDDRSWNLYQSSGGKLSKKDWRREHVNDFVKRAHQAIQKEKPFVKFGISPFGIWRPGFPQSVVGMDQYDKLYADAKLWLNKGWVDYFSPQLYWKISQIGQSFPELLGWWQQENWEGRHLWPGINVNFGEEWNTTTEVLNQIMITRGMLPNSKGTIHWSIGPLMKDKSLSEALLEGPYREEALVPPSPWINNTPPQQPQLEVSPQNKDELLVRWSHPQEKEIFKWVLYLKYKNGNWQHRVFAKEETEVILQFKSKTKHPIEFIGVTAVDRTGNQSEFFKQSVE